MRRAPALIYLLIVLNVLTYTFGPILSESALPSGLPANWAREAFNTRFGAIPAELTHNQDLSSMRVRTTGDGGQVCPAPEIENSPPVSALTSLFVHNSLTHLLSSMLILLVFGMRVERRLGRARFTMLTWCARTPPPMGSRSAIRTRPHR